MSEPARYTIEKVEDLLVIPDDKLEACLIDLATWVRITAAAKLIATLVAVKDVPGQCGPGRFVWIDDDKHIARITVEVDRGKG